MLPTAAAACLGLVLAAAPMDSARAQLCPTSAKPPQVVIKTDSGTLRFNRDLGETNLKALMHKLERNMHLTRGQPLGITVGSAGAWYQTGIRYRKLQHGGTCVWLNKAEVTIGYKDMTVYIDRKYDKGTCEYDAILGHEMTHVKINRETVKSHLPQVRQALGSALRAKPHIRILGNQRQVRDAYLLYLRQKLQPILNTLEAQRQRRNARIDTPESYREILEQCANW